jgi:hypothetical protein
MWLTQLYGIHLAMHFLSNADNRTADTWNQKQAYYQLIRAVDIKEEFIFGTHLSMKVCFSSLKTSFCVSLSQNRDNCGMATNH